MAHKITYSDVDRKLASLGFKGQAVKGSHRVFRHARKKSVIILPYRRLSEIVDRTRLAMVREVLVSTGVVAPEVFADSFFQNAQENGRTHDKVRRKAGMKA